MPHMPPTEPDQHLVLDRRSLTFGSLSTLAAWTAIAAPAAAQTFKLRVPPRIAPIDIVGRPIDAFHINNRARRQFGRLRFLGGLVLKSASSTFGGWSGLVIDPDGQRFMAISDQGAWLTGRIAYTGTTPSAIQDARIGPILGLGGRALTSKFDLDAEGLTLLDGTLTRGTVLVSFEGNVRIGLFPVSTEGLGPPTGYLKLPRDARRMKSNRQLEAVCLVRGGRYKGSVIAFAEELLDTNQNHSGWIWPGGPSASAQPIGILNKDGYAITDIASLPDGSLIVLERFFRWSQGVRMRLRLIPVERVIPGATLDGEILLAADQGYEIDNMEGLALHQNTRGETILTLISDDNFNTLLQRTILLQFALAVPRQRDQGGR